MESHINKYSGFTLVEIIVVIGILTFLATGAVYMGQFLLSGTNLNASVHNITTALETARDYTLDHYNNSSNYGVYFTSSTFSIYAGTTYTGSNTIVDKETLPTGISISNISFNSNAYVYFQSVSGLASASGSIKVSSVLVNHTISVNTNGIVSLQ